MDPAALMDAAEKSGLDARSAAVRFLFWIRSERRDLRRMEGQLAALGGNNA